MRNKKYVILGLVLILFSLKTFYDYREKSLDRMISYNASNFNSMLVNFELYTENKEHAEDLTKFLSQYRVKKISSNEYQRDFKEMRGFHILVNPHNGKSTLVSISGDRLLHSNGSYYKVLNGPIDLDWVTKFIEELHQQ